MKNLLEFEKTNKLGGLEDLKSSLQGECQRLFQKILDQFVNNLKKQILFTLSTLFN